MGRRYWPAVLLVIPVLVAVAWGGYVVRGLVEPTVGRNEQKPASVNWAPRPQPYVAPVRLPRTSEQAAKELLGLLPQTGGGGGTYTFSEHPSGETVDQALKKLDVGKIAFNVPPHMRVGKTQPLQVALGLNNAAVVIASAITVPGQTTTAELRVSKKMQATLVGAGAFDVAPGGPRFR